MLVVCVLRAPVVLLGCDFVRIYIAMHTGIRTGRNSVFKMVSSVFFLFFSLFCDFVGTLEYLFAQIHRYADKVCLK